MRAGLAALAVAWSLRASAASTGAPAVRFFDPMPAGLKVSPAVGAPFPTLPILPSATPKPISGLLGAPRIAHNNIYDYTGVDPDTGDRTFGNYINRLIGAERFYETGVLDDDPGRVVGIFGQGTYSSHIDAGHPWAGPNGHSTLTGMVVNDPNVRYSPTDAAGNVLVVTEPQAHATEVAMTIAGGGAELRQGATSTLRLGIAPWTNLGSGAVATVVASDGSGYFETTAQTYLATYRHFAEATWTRTINYYIADGVSMQSTITGPTDVINTSFGYLDPAGIYPETVAMDALARAHSKTTFVVAAGNSGPSANTIGGPASGYNVITVGAVGDGTMSGVNQVASFSSRGAQDFAGNPATSTVVPRVRAAVDIVAPGYYIVTATYDGPTTGRDDAVAASGTSFAAPIVASGVALLDSLSYHLSANVEYADFDRSRDARVIKAVLLNSADKLPGWDNGQQKVSGVTRTQQGLDLAQGAGRINLDRAFDQYVGGTLDPWGLAGPVLERGWSLASVGQGGHVDYIIGSPLTQGQYLDATLTWFRDRTLPQLDAETGEWDPANSSLVSTDLAMAILNLEIWDASFTRLYAISETPYNTVQHLHYLLDEDGAYALRVTYTGQVFGVPDPAGETYALAWNAVVVPEPGGAGLLMILTLVALRQRKKQGPG